MLDYSIVRPDGILVLKPSAPLSKEDFGGLSAAVDSYLADHARLHGLLIVSRVFPGWENFGAFIAHMQFVHQHHKKIVRVAVVTDSQIAGMAEALAKHFTSAEVKHFPFADDVKALAWLQAA